MNPTPKTNDKFPPYPLSLITNCLEGVCGDISPVKLLPGGPLMFSNKETTGDINTMWTFAAPSFLEIYGERSYCFKGNLPLLVIKYSPLLLLHLVRSYCRGQNQSTAFFYCWPKCAHRGIFHWFLLSFWPPWTIPDNAFTSQKWLTHFHL